MPDLDRELSLRRARLLGWGIAAPPMLPGVDIGRDIVLAEGADGRGRDVARVVGVDALAQDLGVAFTTALGTDVLNVAFGFDGLRALVEETNPVLLRERVRIAVIQVLRRDPRVRRVLDVTLDGDGGGALERPSGGGGRVLRVRVAFETVSGDQATADLGRVVLDG